MSPDRIYQRSSDITEVLAMEREGWIVVGVSRYANGSPSWLLYLDTENLRDDRRPAVAE